MSVLGLCCIYSSPSQTIRNVILGLSWAWILKARELVLHFQHICSKNKATQIWTIAISSENPGLQVIAFLSQLQISANKHF